MISHVFCLYPDRVGVMDRGGGGQDFPGSGKLTHVRARRIMLCCVLRSHRRRWLLALAWRWRFILSAVEEISPWGFIVPLMERDSSRSISPTICRSDGVCGKSRVALCARSWSLLLLWSRLAFFSFFSQGTRVRVYAKPPRSSRVGKGGWAQPLRGRAPLNGCPVPSSW